MVFSRNPWRSILVETSGSVTLTPDCIWPGTIRSSIANYAPSANLEVVVVGSNREHPVPCENIDLVFYSKEGTNVTLMKCAHVLGINFNLFSLHTMLGQNTVVMGPAGVHVLGGSLIPTAVRRGQISLQPKAGTEKIVGIALAVAHASRIVAAATAVVSGTSLAPPPP